MKVSNPLLPFLLIFMIFGNHGCFGGDQAEEQLEEYGDQEAERNSSNINEYTDETNLVEESGGNLDQEEIEENNEEVDEIDEEIDLGDEIVVNELEVDEDELEDQDNDVGYQLSQVNEEKEANSIISNLSGKEEIDSSATSQKLLLVESNGDKKEDSYYVDPGVLSFSPGTRVVRYINDNGATIYSEKSTSSQSVGILLRGDLLIVNIDGEWAEISKGRYVKTSYLDDGIVARMRIPIPWR